MKLKKILGITGVAIASVALLAACSSKSPKEASKSSGAKETIKLIKNNVKIFFIVYHFSFMVFIWQHKKK